MSMYKGHSVVDNLELEKRAEERRTVYDTCWNCKGDGQVPPCFKKEGPCSVCKGRGMVVKKQGKA